MIIRLFPVYILPYSVAKKRDFSRIENMGALSLMKYIMPGNKETQLFEKLTI